MTYDDLRGNLLAFGNTYLKKDTKIKGLALKSVTNPRDDEFSDNSSENEFVLFVKKFRKMVKLKERSKRNSSRKQKKDFSKVICYNCKETGHFKSDCPKLKKEEKPKKGKKKGLMASWEDLENDSEEDEQSETKSQTCLMADHVEQVVFHYPDTEDLHLTIDHLSGKIRCFLLENQDLESQITILKAENSFLKDKLREAETAIELVEENKQLKAQLKSCEYHHSVTANLNYFEENDWLHKEIRRLKEDLAKFTQSSKNLNQLLTSQKLLYDKTGLGFHKALKSVCLASKRKDNMWYMDSGCSRHMTGKATFFIKLDEYDGGFVTFGDNGKGKIVAIGKAEAVNTACYILNRTIIRKGLKKTPYELWKGTPPNLKYFHVFGCKCFVLNNKENLGTFDPMSYERMFVGYSTTSKAYRIYLKEHRTIEKSIHVSICDSNSIPSVMVDDDDDAGCEDFINQEGSEENPKSVPSE
ncbi:uncharacterized protein LOC130980715 [Arachis stenosperma]|uniref:uncharacterized protein LOC130980715 n=1 Tax=Arachis stenosperma TaxID=217475 RepID=UPI0025ACE3F3|nr:uncharacterized protein LOC130980715 [Arachis stenosperma]